MLKRKRTRNPDGTYNQKNIEHNNRAYIQYVKNVKPWYKKLGLTRKEFETAGLLDFRIQK